MVDAQIFYSMKVFCHLHSNTCAIWHGEALSLSNVGNCAIDITEGGKNDTFEEKKKIDR